MEDDALAATSAFIDYSDAAPDAGVFSNLAAPYSHSLLAQPLQEGEKRGPAPTSAEKAGPLSQLGTPFQHAGSWGVDTRRVNTQVSPLDGQALASPPATPQQPSHSLQHGMSISPAKAPVQQMQQMRLTNMRSTPALAAHAAPTEMRLPPTMLGQAPWLAMSSSVGATPSYSPMAMPPWAAAMQQMPTYVDPASMTMRAGGPSLPSRGPHSDGVKLAGSPAVSGSVTPTSPTLSDTPQKLMSPHRVLSYASLRAPRKAQSTPLFERHADDNSGVAPSMLMSPSKVRGPPKAVRRLASHRRMSTQANSGAEAGKAPAGRLRVRGSMAALREANAMHAAAKSGGSTSAGVRRPLQLSFVNYGLEDAEELCSAVAPSGSYKVPLRGYRDSDDEDAPGPPATAPETEAGRTASSGVPDWSPLPAEDDDGAAPAASGSPHGSLNEPTTPQPHTAEMPCLTRASPLASPGPGVSPGKAALRRTTVTLRDYQRSV